VYLVDSSAWVEYLRDTNSPTCNEVDRLWHEHPADVHLTEPVIMELLAGPNDTRTVQRLETLISGLPLLAVNAFIDYRAAASAARASRQRGHPIRSLVGCLIAAVAVRTEVELVHRDRDFDHLAECLPDLRVHQF
jgi:hypothetical protein